MNHNHLVWIKELSNTLRECGVLEYERYIENKQGRKETIKIKLGTLPVKEDEGIELVKLPIEPEDVIKKNNKKDTYFDLFGYTLSDQELEELPDAITRKTG